MTKFGIGLLGDQPVLEMCEFARLAEENGYEYVWVADESPSPPFRDVFVAMTAIALKTERVKLATGVCNPYSRHPAQIAVAIWSLNEIARGRVLVGLGPGGSVSLRPLGIEMWNKPVSAIRESFKILRGMFAGETVNLEGGVLRAVNCKLGQAPQEKIPIYLAARGPKMLELVGELSDGALLTTPYEYLDFAVKKIKSAAERAGRKMDEIEIANWLPFAMDMDGDKAKEMVKVEVCFMVADSPDIVHEKVGLRPEDVAAVRAAIKKGIPEAMKKVTREMVDSFSISGTPEECTEKMEMFAKGGVDQIVLSSPFGANPREVLKKVGGEVIPAFR